LLAHRPFWRLLLFPAVLVVVGGLSSCTRQDDPNRPLLWAGDAEGGAPYIIENPSDPSHPFGFEADVVAALSRELGRPIHFKQYDFDGLILGLERGSGGDYDFAMNGLEITPERKKQVRFTRPYYIYRLQLVARDGEQRFHNLDELVAHKDLIIGTLGASAGQRTLERRGVPESRMRLYTDQQGPYKDLLAGRVDGVLMDLPIALYWADPHFKHEYAHPFAGLKFAGAPVDEGYYAIAVRRDNAALAQSLDDALDRLLQRGELKKIYQDWGLWNADQERLSSASVADVAQGDRQSQTLAGYFPLLLSGAAMTVFLTVTSMALAVLLGMFLAVGRLYGPAPVRWLVIGYIEFFRGIPVLFLVYFLYFGLAFLLNLDARLAAILAFGLNYAAYEAEIYRAGISAIPAGQWEAAASLGMSGPLTFRRIILPQAVRTILPPMTNDLVSLFKDTSVVSVIAVIDLSKRYQLITKEDPGVFLQAGVATAALYLLMSVPLGYLSRHLEKVWGPEE
jgi:polar amino acid transport system substrate-binding protein